MYKKILLIFQIYEQGKGVLGYSVLGGASAFMARYVRGHSGARLVAIKKIGQWWNIEVEYPEWTARRVSAAFYPIEQSAIAD